MIPETPIGKRILIIINDWKKLQPYKKRDMRNFMKMYEISSNALYKGFHGNPGLTLLNVLENELGYSHDWILSGTGARKSGERTKHHLTDIQMEQALVTKLRQDIYSMGSRLAHLEKDIAHLKPLEKEVHELKRIVADLQEKIKYGVKQPS